MSLILPSRRNFLVGLAAVLAAPAVVRASSLMPISSAKLVTPSTDIIGEIKPIVGKIPDGWIECNGKWLSRRVHAALYAVIGDKYGTDGRDTFHVPNLSDMASLEQNVGRYVIYGGEDVVLHKRWLDETTRGLDVRRFPPDPRDSWHTVDWSYNGALT